MVRKTYNYLFFIFYIGISTLYCSPTLAALTTSVDRTRIAENDILSLTIRSNEGPVEGKLDLSDLKRDFEVLNTQRSNQVSIINGKRTANYDLILVLAPKRTGTLTIPAFRVDNQQSAPISISVSAGKIDQNKELAEVFLDNEVSTPEAYVQEQILYTLRLYHAVGLEDASISPLEVENAVVKKLGEQRKYETVLKGIRYSVIEIRYAIFPQSSGRLEIPAQLFSGRTTSQFLGFRPYDSRIVRTRSATYFIDVLPKPASYPEDQPWLPTWGIKVKDSWEEALPELRVGDPVTRTIEITGRGLTAAQLPDVELRAPEGVKMYPDQSQTDDLITDDGIVGQSSFATAFVPSREGMITLPGFSITWWNTQRDKLETTEVPAKTIRVLPASNRVTVPPVPAQPAPIQLDTSPVSAQHSTDRQDWLWPTITIIMTLLWLGTLWLLLRSRRAGVGNTRDTQESVNSRRAFSELQSACRQDDPINARRAFIRWMAAQFPDRKLNKMDDARSLIDDDELLEALDKLDTWLYAGSHSDANWSGKKLLTRCSAFRKNLRKQPQQDESTAALKPLYPL